MLFEINVRLTDDDYLKFNEFLLIRSYYGKKQMMNRRILIALITLIISAVVLFRYGLSDVLLFASIYCFVMAIYQIFLNKLTQRSIRRRIKFLKKKGKLKYSPESVMRFYDDVLSEITPDEKTERKYSVLERVSIVGDVVYIHINVISAYIIPRASFESEEQYNAFLEFIKTKFENIDVY